MHYYPLSSFHPPAIVLYWHAYLRAATLRVSLAIVLTAREPHAAILGPQKVF